MKIFDVCTRITYEKEGEKKTKWYRAGLMKETENGNKYLRFYHQPEIEYFLFEKVKPEENTSAEGQ